MSAWDQLQRIVEAPVDWRKSYRKAVKGMPFYKRKGLEVPKAAPKPPQVKPMRGGEQPEGDPLKTTATAEVFETEKGMYVVMKGIGGKHHAIFVDADVKKAQDLGQFSGRKEAIDAALAHHDRLQGGFSEGR